MRYGYFDDTHHEYVITQPDTPLPWLNYLGCEAYFGLISNTAGGYSFYRDARLRRLTRYRYNNVPLDYGGRYIYLTFSEEPGESFQTTTNKDGTVAESVFIAGLFVLAANEMAELAEVRDRQEEAQQYREAAVIEKQQSGWKPRPLNTVGMGPGSCEPTMILATSPLDALLEYLLSCPA